MHGCVGRFACRTGAAAANSRREVVARPTVCQPLVSADPRGATLLASTLFANISPLVVVFFGAARTNFRVIISFYARARALSFSPRPPPPPSSPSPRFYLSVLFFVSKSYGTLTLLASFFVSFFSFDHRRKIALEILFPLPRR